MRRNSSYRHILIVADIEGSSGCWSRRGAAFGTPEWVRACEGMSEDVGAVASSLLQAGVEGITVNDFHRTGYNLLPERIPPAVNVVQGYRTGPVAGIGNPRPAEAVIFLGLHAASGTDGFLAHTLTSRLADIRVNGRPLPEVQLFAASLAPYGLRPLLFSGCPAACRQARDVIPQMTTYAIDKSTGRTPFSADDWRAGLAVAAREALRGPVAPMVVPQGPLHTVVTLRDGPAAAGSMARRWGLDHRRDMISFTASDMHALYRALIRISYLTPGVEKHLRWYLPLFNLLGRMGMVWLRWQLRRG